MRQITGALPREKWIDLNGDGIVDENENTWPRADLNGSGKLSRSADDRRRMKGEDLSDLDIMMKAWEDTSVSAAALPAMLD
jgi:hypothetical protein